LLFGSELAATSLSRGLTPPGHFAGRFRSPLDSACHGAARRARRTKDEAITRAALTITPSALGLEGAFAVYDVEQGSLFGQYTADMREADRLSIEDAEGNAVKIAELNDRNRDAERRATYDPGGWKRIGTGPRFDIVVPARDFATLIVE
jgi:hypothetical protein